jgi:hypothetical protein
MLADDGRLRCQFSLPQARRFGRTDDRNPFRRRNYCNARDIRRLDIRVLSVDCVAVIRAARFESDWLRPSGP